MQEARLLQLRKWIADLQKGKVPSDTTLLRFLRARDFNVEKAREMLSQSLLWRKKHQVDRLLSEYETPDVVKQYFPGGWHHHDKDGRPLYVLRLGQMDVKGLLKSIGEDGLLKLTLHVCEEGLKLLEEASGASSRAVQAWSLLVDLDGLNMRHLWRPGVRALLRVIQLVEANYPETMGRVLIVRAPRVFPILWTIVSTFIDENTRSKFLFYGGKDYLQPGGLLDYIPKDLIPDFLGGPCKSFVHEGGLVPKSLYVSGAFTEREGDPLSEDSIYRSVSLGKGQVHEVIVPNRDPQSVLTWDFDVLRHDIAFTVYRTEHELSHPPQDTTALCVGGADEAKSVLEQKGWREGEHYHRVEPTLVCHDGESIQGSHVMLACGSYILQWRCELLDSAHRAAQLMYFHETLASHHYKCVPHTTHTTTSPTHELLDSAHRAAQLMYFHETLASHHYKCVPHTTHTTTSPTHELLDSAHRAAQLMYFHETLASHHYKCVPHTTHTTTSPTHELLDSAHRAAQLMYFHETLASHHYKCVPHTTHTTTSPTHELLDSAHRAAQLMYFHETLASHHYKCVPHTTHTTTSPTQRAAGQCAPRRAAHVLPRDARQPPLQVRTTHHTHHHLTHTVSCWTVRTAPRSSCTSTRRSPATTTSAYHTPHTPPPHPHSELLDSAHRAAQLMYFHETLASHHYKCVPHTTHTPRRAAHVLPRDARQPPLQVRTTHHTHHHLTHTVSCWTVRTAPRSSCTSTRRSPATTTSAYHTPHTPPPHPHSELLDSAHRAAQLMYFHETLASHHYKCVPHTTHTTTSPTHELLDSAHRAAQLMYFHETLASHHYKCVPHTTHTTTSLTQ
ncbi:unnamed protein product [Chrysodeixis includens]|uniref:Protein real-time n=1 Tax=Chrysodeixis includens TaxID=689277 RepID=A0A9P0BP62_CHRIL|nr:unnamed protein product [Chrysodeixis includens]